MSKTLYKQFFTQLLAHPQQPKIFAQSVIEEDTFLRAEITDRCEYRYRVNAVEASVNLEISFRDVIKNHKIFHLLLADADEIHRLLGAQLDWRIYLDDARLMRKRRISWQFPGMGYSEKDTWPTTHDQLVRAMTAFEQVFTPRLEQALATVTKKSTPKEPQ